MGFGKSKSSPAPAATSTNTYVQAAPQQPIERTQNPVAAERAQSAPSSASLLTEEEQKKNYTSSMLG